MLRLLFDENFHHDIIRGVRRLIPEAGLRAIGDPDLLAWAAGQNRILLTHDVRTCIGFSRERIRAGEPCPGVFAGPDTMPIGEAIDQISLLVLASEMVEWKDLITFLPIR